jgi:hypothetical protein
MLDREQHFPRLAGVTAGKRQTSKKKNEKTLKKAANIRFIGLFACYSILRETPMMRKMRFS